MWEKEPLSVFNISENLSNYQQQKTISGLFWAYKSKLQIIHVATYISLFLPDCNNCFSVCLVPYLSIIFSFFVFIFTFLLILFLPRNILQFTMFDFILLQHPHNTMQIKILHSPQQKKICCVDYNQPNTLIFLWYKVFFFLPPYQFTFFLVFDQATDQKGFFSSCSHILMNILSMNYYNYFVTKRSLNNFHTESFH